MRYAGWLSVVALAATAAASADSEDSQPPVTPEPTVTATSRTTVALAWEAVDTAGVVRYRVFEGDRLVGPTDETTYTVDGLECGTKYTFGVEAHDEAGNVSPRGSIVAVTDECPDTEPPGVPTGLVVTATGKTKVDLTWQAATDDVGVDGYRVFAGERLVRSTTSTAYAVDGLECGTKYTLGVEAFDAAGNSSPRASVGASTDACEEAQPSPPPPPPSPPPPAAKTAGATTTAAAAPAAASLSPNPEADAFVYEALANQNYGQEQYLRAQGGTDLEQSSYLRFSVAGLTGPANRALLRLYVHSGSRDGPAVYATSNDWAEQGITWNTRPAATSGVLDDALEIPYGVWVEYDVTSRITGDGTYSFLLVSDSFDGVSMNSREGAQPPELVVTGADEEAPSAPVGVSVGGVSANSVSLTWAGAADNVGVDGYRIYAGDRLVASTTSTAYTVDGLACGTSYTLGVEALDAAGNVSPRSSVVASTSACVDTQPPSTPTGLSITAARASQIDLAWQAATDDVGVAGYRVFEGERLVASTTATAHTVDGLACATSYTLGVEAYDAAGNVSQRASIVASTSACADTEPPSAPTGLTATATASSQVELTWQAATDNVGVVGYEIVRNGASIATTGTVTRYSDTGVSAGATYEYVVKAHDAAGNVSAGSVRAVATTPIAPTPTTPGTFAPIADARVEEAAPDTNFGGSTYLRAQAGLDPDERSYLRFSVGGVTAPVARAVLRVYVQSGSVDGPAVYATDNAWSESTITWNSRLAPTSSALDDKLVVSSGSWVEYDVTTRITGNGDYSFVLASTSADGVTMSSREGAQSPQLVVTTGTSDTSGTPGTTDPSGCDKFAARNGSDLNLGTVTSPFKTAQRLANSLSTGQTGCLRAGVYDETSSGYILSLSKGGYAIRSYPGERAKLVGVIIVRSTASGVTLSHLDIEGTGSANTVKIYSADVVIADNDITNAWRGRSCIILGSNDGAGAAVRTIVRRNRFHECGSPANDNKDHSIYAANLQSGRIVDNLFWNHTSRAIQLYPNADGNVVAHNVIDGGAPSVRGGIVIGGSTNYTSSDNVVENNIIAYATTWNLYTNWEGATGTGNVARFNCVWAGGDGNIESDPALTSFGNLVADPLFVNRAARDYRLLAASPCLPVVLYDTAALLPGGSG